MRAQLADRTARHSRESRSEDAGPVASPLIPTEPIVLPIPTRGATTGCPGKTAQMSMSTDKPVPVPDVDNVSVSALTAGEDDDSVADASHRGSHRGCIVGAFGAGVRLQAQDAGALRRCWRSCGGDRRAEKRSVQRFASSLEIVAAGFAAHEPDRLALVAGKRHSRAKHLVDENCAVRTEKIRIRDVFFGVFSRSSGRIRPDGGVGGVVSVSERVGAVLQVPIIAYPGLTASTIDD